MVIGTPGALASTADSRKQHVLVDHLSVDFRVKTPSISNIEWFAATVTIRNHARRVLRLDTRYLGYATSALEFRGPDGARIPHCPPPMPGPVPPPDEIDPGHRIAHDYRAEICVPLAPGRYRVRRVYENDNANDGAWVGGFATDWVDFAVR